MKSRKGLVLVVALATGAGAAAADQLVIVREMHTMPEAPFSGSIRTVQRVEGHRIREEYTVTMNPLPTDSLSGEGSRGDKPLDKSTELTSVWFPEEQVWRTWSPTESLYEESTAQDLKRLHAEAQRGMGQFGAMFGGTPESFVHELEISVDSSGAAATIAGVRARPFVARGIFRFHVLEPNTGDSLRFVREVWMSPAIAETAAPAIRNSPAKVWEQMLLSMQLLMIPALTYAVDGMEKAVARFSGYIMRDELRLEAAAESFAGLTVPDSVKSAVLFQAEVEEIRTEASRPELFRVPAGLSKREPSPQAAPDRSGTGR